MVTRIRMSLLFESGESTSLRRRKVYLAANDETASSSSSSSSSSSTDNGSSNVDNALRLAESVSHETAVEKGGKVDVLARFVLATDELVPPATLEYKTNGGAQMELVRLVLPESLADDVRQRWIVAAALCAASFNYAKANSMPILSYLSRMHLVCCLSMTTTDVIVIYQ
jgi:hypothetical protein